MNKLMFQPVRILKITVLCFLLAGCTTQLAPVYDQQLIVGLNELNESSQVYFEAMSGDLSAKSYDKFEGYYNELIGKVQSLVTQSNARPVPDSKAIDKLNKLLEKKGKQIWDPKDKLPSTVALEEILSDYRELKALHSDGSINNTKYELRKGAIILYLEQAVVFEYALER